MRSSGPSRNSQAHRVAEHGCDSSVKMWPGLGGCVYTVHSCLIESFGPAIRSTCQDVDQKSCVGVMRRRLDHLAAWVAQAGLFCESWRGEEMLIKLEDHGVHPGCQATVRSRYVKCGYIHKDLGKFSNGFVSACRRSATHPTSNYTYQLTCLYYLQGT